jgi:hypothetical protein
VRTVIVADVEEEVRERAAGERRLVAAVGLPVRRVLIPPTIEPELLVGQGPTMAFVVPRVG